MATVNTVYDELDSILIKSSHSDIEQIYYRIFYGNTCWDKNSENLNKSIVIFIQKGNEENWSVAKSKHQIQFLKNPHLLVQDLNKILEAIQYLSNKYM